MRVLLMKKNANDAHVIRRYWLGKPSIRYRFDPGGDSRSDSPTGLWWKGESVDCPAEKRILI